MGHIFHYSIGDKWKEMSGKKRERIEMATTESCSRVMYHVLSTHWNDNERSPRASTRFWTSATSLSTIRTVANRKLYQLSWTWIAEEYRRLSCPPMMKGLFQFNLTGFRLLRFAVVVRLVFFVSFLGIHWNLFGIFSNLFGPAGVGAFVSITEVVF